MLNFSNSIFFKTNQPVNLNYFNKLFAVLALVSGITAGLQAQTVTALQLMNANTNSVIRELTNGMVIDLSVDGSSLAVRADAVGVGSVKFVLSGAESYERTESVAPYALHGDVSGNYNSWTPSLGNYNLVTTPWSGSGASGTAGPNSVINFSVINTAPPPPAAGGEFFEQAGLVVMEAESQPLVGSWDLNIGVAGYTGVGYIEWKTGDPFGGVIPGGTDIITYEIIINNPGRYRFQMRSAAPDRTEHNDVWVRFPDNGGLKEKGGVFTSVGTAWIKAYQNADNDTWTWATNHVDNDPHAIYSDFLSPGVYRFQFSGRSTKFKIDRLVLYNSSVTMGFATSTARPESLRNTLVANADFSTTAVNTAVTTNVLSNDTDGTGSILPGSVSIVSGPSNGLAVVNPSGSITYTPNAGFNGIDIYTYQVCNDLGACAQANVNINVSGIDPPVCDVPSNLSVNVISPTTAQLSWDPVLNANGYQFQGQQIGMGFRNRQTTGTSLTFSIFQPGESYAFRVRASCFGGSAISDFSAPFGFTVPTAREGLESQWSLSPNPASDMLYLSSLPETVEFVEAYDLTGRLVGQWAAQGTVQLNVSALEEGSYLIRLRHSDGRSDESRQIIIMR